MIKERPKVSAVLVLLFLGVTLQVVGGCAELCQAASKQISFRRHFSCYNCNIDWQALSDSQNNSILNTCLGGGATLGELGKLDIEDLNKRLDILEKGNLLSISDETYQLAFPAIVGEKRDRLQEIVNHTARAVLPSTQKMLEQIRSHLQAHEHMLYHVVWSLVMDGKPAWIRLQNQLKKQLDRDVTFTDTTWVIYPSHPYCAGTNSYYDDATKMGTAITWTPTTPMPTVVVENLMPYSDDIIQSISRNQPLADHNAVDALTRYGLTDDKGALRIYTLDVNTPAFRIFAKSGMIFASEVMKHLNLQEVVRILGTSQEEALVIAYHELCYELLKQLADKRILEVPEIALKPQTLTVQMYRLISIISISDPNALQKLIEGEF